MINWINIIKDYIIKNKILDNEKDLLLKTARAANLLEDEIFTISINNILAFCEDDINNKKIKMIDNKTLKLLPGYRKTDWLNFFNIDEINNKMKEIQLSLLNFDKNAALVGAANSGDIKELKGIIDIQAKTQEKSNQIFIYTNVESLLEENKKNIIHKCQNCQFEFLCQEFFN